jgi:hypothetical protein
MESVKKHSFALQNTRVMSCEKIKSSTLEDDTGHVLCTQLESRTTCGKKPRGPAMMPASRDFSHIGKTRADKNSIF